MTKIFLLIYGMLSISSFKAQNQIVFFDAESKSPVSKVYLYDCKGILLAISNERGLISIDSEVCYPLNSKHDEFENHEIKSSITNVFLKQKIYSLDELVVKPINKMDLYNAIINKSSNMVSRDMTWKYGIYFESMTIIDVDRSDTAFTSKKCSMAIQKEWRNRKPQYNLYYEKGEKYHEEFKNDEWVNDTSVIYNLLKILYGFESSLEYDLSDSKKFKLTFEEQEIRRISGENEMLLFTRKKANRKQEQYMAVSKDSVLLLWSFIKTMDSPDAKSYVNYDKSEMTIKFDTNNYNFNSVFILTKMSFHLSGQLYKVYMVKGFEENAELRFQPLKKYNKSEDFFETIPFSKLKIRFYEFF